MNSLFQLIKHYQETGEILPEIYEHKLNFLLNNIQEFFDEYIRNYKEDGLEFEDYIRMSISDWEVDIGLGLDMSIHEDVMEYLEGIDEEELQELMEILDEGEDSESH